MNMTSLGRFGVGLCLVALAGTASGGCFFSQLDDDDQSVDVDDDFGGDVDDDFGDEELEVVGWRLICTLEASIEIEATAELLVTDLRSSLAEMIGCGQLTVELTSGVRSGVAEAITQGKSDATPDGWTYAGQGTYTTSAARAAMETRFYSAEDFEFAKAGDPIEDDVFLVDSYLVGASLRIPDPLSLRAELSYSQVGPLVELLGYGASPPNPIELSVSDLARIGDKLANLEFESEVRVEDTREESTIMYAIHTPRLPAHALLGGGSMRYELDSLIARNGELEVDVTEWSSLFVANGRIDGEVSFDINVEAKLECEAVIDFLQLPRTSGD